MEMKGFFMPFFCVFLCWTSPTLLFYRNKFMFCSLDESGNTKRHIMANGGKWRHTMAYYSEWRHTILANGTPAGWRCHHMTTRVVPHTQHSAWVVPHRDTLETHLSSGNLHTGSCDKQRATAAWQVTLLRWLPLPNRPSGHAGELVCMARVKPPG